MIIFFGLLVEYVADPVLISCSHDALSNIRSFFRIPVMLNEKFVKSDVGIPSKINNNQKMSKFGLQKIGLKFNFLLCVRGRRPRPLSTPVEIPYLILLTY